MLGLDFIYPDWPASPHVKAVTTTRRGGFSRGVYESLNFSNRVGDNPEQVRANRELLRGALRLPAEPAWLTQVHGARVLDAFAAGPNEQADGCFTGTAGTVCAVLTADCMPIFLCDRRATRVALLHAGWRGLAAGIIEAGLRCLQMPGGNVLAWLGPAIGPASYEVGEDVRRSFVSVDPAASEAFTPGAHGRWYADLYGLARRRLQLAGVQAVYGGNFCTVRERARFFSYRRDGVCGRMASLIWLERDAGRPSGAAGSVAR